MPPELILCRQTLRTLDLSANAMSTLPNVYGYFGSSHGKQNNFF